MEERREGQREGRSFSICSSFLLGQSAALERDSPVSCLGFKTVSRWPESQLREGNWGVSPSGIWLPCNSFALSCYRILPSAVPRSPEFRSSLFMVSRGKCVSPVKVKGWLSPLCRKEGKGFEECTCSFFLLSTSLPGSAPCTPPPSKVAGDLRIWAFLGFCGVIPLAFCVPSSLRCRCRETVTPPHSSSLFCGHACVCMY